MGRFQIEGSWIEANRYDEARQIYAAKRQIVLEGGTAENMVAKHITFLAARNPVKTDLASIMKPDAAFDFNGHATDKLGIGTKFKVSAILNFPDLNVAGIGGLEWKVISGAALPDVDKNAGTIEAVANDPAGVKLKLVGVAGALSGLTIVNEIFIRVVEPESAVAIKSRGYSSGGARQLSAFMDVDYWLTPDDVSFIGIEWQEPGGEVAAATNNMANVRTWAVANGRMDLVTHGGNPATWMRIQKEHQGRRNWIIQTDTVGNTFGTECGPGTFTWTISWAYRVVNPRGASKVFKRDVVHRLTATANGQRGQATIEKMGASHTELYTVPPPALPVRPPNQLPALAPRNAHQVAAPPRQNVLARRVLPALPPLPVGRGP